MLEERSEGSGQEHSSRPLRVWNFFLPGELKNSLKDKFCFSGSKIIEGFVFWLDRLCIIAGTHFSN